MTQGQGSPVQGAVISIARTPGQLLGDFAKPGRCSYLYFGAGMQRPPPTAVIACDRPMNHEGEGIFVLYGSGTVKWVPAAQAQQLLASLRPGCVWPQISPPPPTTQH